MAFSMNANHGNGFPRGLVQPTQGFRFSIDALLLSCFAANRSPSRVIDLGTGCGVISLGLILRRPRESFAILGVDTNPEMIAAAQINARKLTASQRFSPVLGDVTELAAIPEFQPGSFDLALCNPPYRLIGHGRTPLNESKKTAMFEAKTRIEDFLSGASQALKTKGRLCLIHLPEHLPRLLDRLVASGLEPKRLRLIHAFTDKPASLLLLEARKGCNPGLSVEPPLILYLKGRSADGGIISRTTAQALEFCPFLDCNSSRPSPSRPGAL